MSESPGRFSRNLTMTLPPIVVSVTSGGRHWRGTITKRRETRQRGVPTAERPELAYIARQTGSFGPRSFGAKRRVMMAAIFDNFAEPSWSTSRERTVMRALFENCCRRTGSCVMRSPESVGLALRKNDDYLSFILPRLWPSAPVFLGNSRNIEDCHEQKVITS